MRFYFEHYIGDDTGVKVKCCISGGQKEILHPSEKAQPGYDAEVEIEGVFIGEDDIYSCLSSDCIESLAQEAWDNLPDVTTLS